MPRKHRIIPPLTPQDKERFWAKVQKGQPNECWEWQAGCFWDGYGEFRFKGQSLRAHRVAWTVANGPIPDGLCVLHSCDNPPCQNPRHFWLGTNKDNTLDRARKGRNGASFGDKNGARLHPESLPRGERHWHAKVTEQNVRDIRRRYATGGVSQYALAREFGVHVMTICAIIHRKTWAHVGSS